MTRKKKTQEKSNSISKGIRACTVVLHDIALETDLIQRYQLHLPLKKEQLSKQSASCINTSLHSNISTDKQLIKKNTRKKNATKNEKYTITKNLKKERKDYKKIKSQQSGKEINKNISLNYQYYEATPKFILSKCIAPEQQLIHHSNVESFSSTNTNETSSTTSTDTHFTYMQKMTILNNKNVRRPNTEKNKKLDSKIKLKILNLNRPDGTCNADIKSIKMGSNENCLDKKNLTVTDYNSNMQEMSSKSITYKQCNNNLHLFNFSDEINCKIKQELYEKSQNSKDNIVQTTCGGKSSKNETLTPIKQNLPKIIANCVLPKGIKILKGVRIEKLRINNSLQSNIPTQISLEQDVKTRCNNDKSIAQTFCNDTTEIITTIENIREKKTSYIP